MAGSPRLLQAFYRLYFGFWVPTLVWAATRWPLALMYWMARWLVILPFGIIRPKYLRAVRGNYARILALPENHHGVRRTAWRMMFEHAYHWIDFFRWAQRSPEAIQGNFAGLEGFEHFERARASGCGTLLLAAHLGNPEVGAVAFGLENGPLHVLYWRDRFEVAEEFRARMRARGNVHGIPVDASPMSVVPALRVLREGGIVAAHGDRDFNNQGWPVSFFGAEAKFPPGPFLLASRAGALIVPTFFFLTPDRRFRAVYEAPIAVGEGRESVRAAQRGWVALLERRIRELPEQWYCFYPFWGDEAGVLDRTVART
jgi:KDO2-lipid IV(A) lauroyltransferase